MALVSARTSKLESSSLMVLANIFVGADLTEREPNHESLIKSRRRKRLGERCIHALRDMDQITIANWHGAAMGGGAAIASALDFRIGAKSCFVYPEIKIGA